MYEYRVMKYFGQKHDYISYLSGMTFNWHLLWIKQLLNCKLHSVLLTAYVLILVQETIGKIHFRLGLQFHSEQLRKSKMFLYVWQYDFDFKKRWLMFQNGPHVIHVLMIEPSKLQTLMKYICSKCGFYIFMNCFTFYFRSAFYFDCQAY